MKKANISVLAAVIAAAILSSCGGTAKKTTSTGTVGKPSSEVALGNQVWMTKNLSVETFRNGDTIPHLKTQAEWAEAEKSQTPGWCYYGHKQENGEVHGKLYNWFAVTDARGLAPQGWKIPSVNDWSLLIRFLGGESVAGKKLKSKSLWNDMDGKSGNGTNETGFNSFPSGNCNSAGDFYSLGFIGGYWTSTESSTYDGNAVIIQRDGNALVRGRHKAEGYSVRCFKE